MPGRGVNVPLLQTTAPLTETLTLPPNFGTPIRPAVPSGLVRCELNVPAAASRDHDAFTAPCGMVMRPSTLVRSPGWGTNRYRPLAASGAMPSTLNVSADVGPVDQPCARLMKEPP